jgi:hypothetical protein
VGISVPQEAAGLEVEAEAPVVVLEVVVVGWGLGVLAHAGDQTGRRWETHG